MQPWIRALVVLLFLVLTASPVTFAGSADTVNAAANAEVVTRSASDQPILAPPAQTASEIQRVAFVYFNDFHGALEPIQGNPATQQHEAYGIARMVTAIRDLHKANTERGVRTFLVTAGDFVQGSNLSNHYKGMIEADIFNRVHMDFWVNGNHELDFGPDQLVKLTQTIRAKNVNGNCMVDGKPIGGLVIAESNGLTIGIAGLSDPVHYSRSRPKVNPAYLDRVAVTGPIEDVARQAVAELRNRGADMIVLITHVGVDIDVRLARAIPDIALIIGGDSHTAIEGVLQENNGQTSIVQAGEKGKYIGYVEAIFSGKRFQGIDAARLIPLDETVPPAPDIVALVAEKKAALQAEYDEVVAVTDVFLDGEAKSIRSKETNLGDIICDALRGAYPEADIALYNSGGIRNSIPPGEVTKGALMGVLPFHDNKIQLMQVTGQTIREALDFSAKSAGGGGFLQVSGLTCELTPGVGADKITINGEPLDPDRGYMLVTNSFVASGGDGYTMFRDIPPEDRRVEPSPSAVVIAYIRKNFGDRAKKLWDAAEQHPPRIINPKSAANIFQPIKN